MVFLYAASDSSNAFRMFLLLMEFSLGPDPCDDPPPDTVPPLPSPPPPLLQQPVQQRILAETMDVAVADPPLLLLMGLPRFQGGLYFTAGLLTSLAQKTANLAALYLSFVIIGSGETVRGKGEG